MKRLLFHCLIVLVASLLFVQTSFAQEATESAKNEYQLPYPGLLPDNPLYFLKVAKDRIIVFLISDPFRKAQFDFKASDKRFSAGIALFEKGKYELSESTISKGLNYFEEGLENLGLAKKEGKLIELGLLTNMELSTKVYVENLEKMVSQTKDNSRENFSKDLKRARDLLKIVESLKLQ